MSNEGVVIRGWPKGKTRPRLEHSPRWKGGVTHDRHGNEMVYLPDHPQARANGYVLRKRLEVVSEASLY